MQFVYIDESGINYKLRTDNGLFCDNPIVTYGAICIDDRKYFHLERAFINYIGKFFGISDWRNTEVHGTDIWARKGYFSGFSAEHIRAFFEEFIQLVAKMQVPFLVGHHLKTPNANAEEQKTECVRAAYSLLQLAESYLAQVNETGIIISDGPEGGVSSLLLNKLFKECTDWKFGIEEDKIITTKYPLQSRSYFLLDTIHYVDSKKSLFNQIIDILLFINGRVMFYDYLFTTNPGLANTDMVPVSVDSFSYFLDKCVKTATISKYFNDICYASGSELEKLDVYRYYNGNFSKVFIMHNIDI